MAFLALSPLQHLQGKPFLCQYAPNKIKSMNKVLRSSTVVSPTAMFGLRHPPYELNALEPFMSKHTLETHWGKHQRGYVDNLNKQIEGSYLQGYTLEDLIKTTYSNGNPMPPFNNAAQVWNHNFFWESMQPEGGGECEGPIKMFIERDFGSYEDFLEEFKNNANSLFGSGWIWFSVSVKDRKLVVEKTKNAINPMIWNHIPLLTVDVWEHAYYLDYQNRRGDYVSTFFEHLVSWETVNDRFGRALSFVNFGEPLIPEL